MGVLKEIIKSVIVNFNILGRSINVVFVYYKMKVDVFRNMRLDGEGL